MLNWANHKTMFVFLFYCAAGCFSMNGKWQTRNGNWEMNEKLQMKIIRTENLIIHCCLIYLFLYFFFDPCERILACRFVIGICCNVAKPKQNPLELFVIGIDDKMSDFGHLIWLSEFKI